MSILHGCCIEILKTLKEKYGKNRKYIIIGHSYGGGLALLFSKLYKNDCILCCCIDNPPYILSYYKKYDDKDNKSIKKFFLLILFTTS